MMKKALFILLMAFFIVLFIEGCRCTACDNSSDQDNNDREQFQSASDYGTVESAQQNKQTPHNASETNTGSFPSDNAHVTPRPSSRTDYSSKVSDPSTCATTTTTITPFSDDALLTITPVPSPQGSEFSTTFPSQDDTDQNNPFTHEGELYFFPDD